MVLSWKKHDTVLSCVPIQWRKLELVPFWLLKFDYWGDPAEKTEESAVIFKFVEKNSNIRCSYSEDTYSSF